MLTLVNGWLEFLSAQFGEEFRAKMLSCDMCTKYENMTKPKYLKIPYVTVQPTVNFPIPYDTTTGFYVLC